MRLAVIATLYGERGTLQSPRLIEALDAQTRPPDEVWFMAEDTTSDAWLTLGTGKWLIRYHNIPTPRNADGRYSVIPYSNKINYALDRTDCDVITYLTDDSLPHPEKYERMVRALEGNPEWGAVYVGQRRNGSEFPADRVVPDAYCRLDHTQVAHRLTEDRWPLDVSKITLGDAHFWRALHARLGPFYPVEGGILDETTQTPDGISSTH